MLIQISASQATFVAIGADAPFGTGRSIAYSIDGISWNLVAQNIFADIGGDVAYSAHQNKWIAVGQGAVNTLAWSADGITWTGLGNNLYPLAGSGVAYSAKQNRWVVVGSGIPNIYYSTDGFTWTAIIGTIFTDSGYKVTYCDALDQWVAVGKGTNTIAFSPDGITWTGLGNIIFSGLYGISVAFANGVYTATGAGTIRQAWSLNGINWTATPEVITGIRYQTVYAQGRWLMVGEAPVNFHNSTDGQSWTAKNNFGGMTAVNGITYNPAYNRYVAVGSGLYSISTSSDGDNWVGRTTTATLFGNFGLKVATTGKLSKIIVNATSLTNDIVNLVTNTSIIDRGTAISITGSLTIMGDLAIDGSWVLQPASVVNVSGILAIKGNTTFGSLQTISCDSLAISSAVGDSKLDVILRLNLTVGSSISYLVVNYKDRVGVFSAVTVRSAPTVTLTSNDCPVASQDYSSSTLTVTVTMTRCSSPPIENFATQEVSINMIIGIAVGCAVLAAVVISVVVLLMRRHRDRADALANGHIRENSINDLKASTIKPNPAFQA